MNRLHFPRFANNSQIFATLLIVILTVLVARGCDFKLPLTATQKAQEAATLAEQEARWSEARIERQGRALFNRVVFFLGRVGGLVLILGAGAGCLCVLTLRGLRWAVSIPAKDGLFPILLGRLSGAWQIHDPNRQVTSTMRLDDGFNIAPVNHAQVASTMGALAVQAEQARASRPHQATAQPSTPALAAPDDQQAPIMAWPGRVPLTRYLDAQGGASLDRVFMGVTCDPATGQQVPVSMPMNDLVHFAVAGSSGFGKTTFINSLLYQFVKSQAVDLAIVDLKSELVAWRNADALRWPVATTRQDGSAILSACFDELQTRKDAFEAIGGAANMADYNARSNGAGQFRPLVAVLDEGTVLLRQDKELTDKATDLVLLGRSFGLWLVLAAQNFKVSSTASEIRDQLTTRVQFHAQDGNQARILLGHDRAQGLGKGRAIARLSGHEQDLELQAPIVTRAEIDALLSGQQGASEQAPVVDVEPVKAQPVANLSPNQEARAVELGERGLSTTAILKDVFGRNGKSGPRARAVNDLLGR